MTYSDIDHPAPAALAVGIEEFSMGGDIAASDCPVAVSLRYARLLCREHGHPWSEYVAETGTDTAAPLDARPLFRWFGY